jgi:hypothetical protein
LAKVRNERQKKAEADRQLKEDLLRVKNIDYLNKKGIFAAKRDIAIRAYVL